MFSGRRSWWYGHSGSLTETQLFTAAVKARNTRGIQTDFHGYSSLVMHTSYDPSVLC